MGIKINVKAQRRRGAQDFNAGAHRPRVAADDTGERQPDVRARRWAIAYLIVLCIGLFMPNPLSYPARWEGHVQDFLHVLAFALLAGALVVLCGSQVIACVASIVVATLVEIVQAGVGRQPSWEDWLLGLCGSAIAASWIMLPKRPAFMRWVTCGTLIALPLGWKVPHYIDAVYFATSFPVLSDFRSPFEFSRWYVEENRLERVRLADGQPAGKAYLLPNSKGESAVILYSFFQDWSRFRFVKCELTVPERPIRLLVSIRNPGFYPDAPHYDLAATYKPGRHTIAIDLAEAAPGRRLSKNGSSARSGLLHRGE